MGRVDRKIIQTVNYIDPNQPAPPNLNYEEVFPITVFDAIRKDMNDETSETLNNVLNRIHEAIQGKQPIFPGRPANYLMTFAGVPGGIGSVQMTSSIPWDHESQSNDKIPTEKAVGDLVRKLGLVDEDGNLISPDRAKVRYSDIIGRPLIYEQLGSNIDGYIHQKGVTDSIKAVTDRIDELHTYSSGISNDLLSHKRNLDNPHAVTIDQIGAASAEVLSQHLSNMDNPHNVTKFHVGLSNADNTSDMDKPISIATQEAIDELKNLLNIMSEDARGFVVDVNYDQESGVFTVTFNNQSFIKFLIPINGLIDDIKYNKELKLLELYELGGEIKHVDLADLFIRYVGSISSSVNVSIIGNNETGEQIIHAIVVPRGITDEELADSSVINRILANDSVTSNKIKDLTITTEKLADGVVVTEKLAIGSVTNTRIADRSVNGRTLFTSLTDNRALVVKGSGTDPIFGQINGDMIEHEAVDTVNLHDGSVTSDKMADKSVITSKLRDSSVTTPKISNKCVTNIKLSDKSVDGRTICPDVELPGTPSIETRPADDSFNSDIPDTRWVMERVRSHINQNINYADRSVDGRVLFSSDVRHRVLTVLRAGSDPVWSQVDGLMLADDSVDTTHIRDGAITRMKISPLSIYNEHLTPDLINETVIRTSAVTSPKIFTSDNENMVLAALTAGGHPVYSKVTGDMLTPNSISTKQLEDGSVTPPKLQSADVSNRLLGVTIKGTTPQWLQANTDMIQDGAITLSKIREVPLRDMVLGSQSAYDHPLWTKVNGNMIIDSAISGKHVAPNSIEGNHIKESTVEGRHILPYQIDSEHLKPNSVGGSQLFTSKYPNRVLAVTDPYSKAEWLEINGDMLRNESITGSKLFRSNYAYRVLGATQVGVPPEYIKITNDFIVDDTIRPQKLIRDFVLYGNPTITSHPDPESNGYDIPDTKWVRDTVAKLIKDFNPEILFDTIDENMIKDHAVGSTKLFRSPYPGPRVLGVTDNNDDPEYILIEEDLIVDGSVSTNKLQRNIHLLGSPQIEVRPSPTAQDSSGEGSLIPDVQWVLDRIAEHTIDVPGGPAEGGGTVGGILEDNSVTTIKIQNRAVTAPKLFTSTVPDRVLAVKRVNGDPEYTTINSRMMENDSVEPRSIFKSIEDNMVMITRSAGSEPEWGKIGLSMMSPKSVGTDQLVDESVVGSKIANHSITRDKFKDVAFVDEYLLFDDSVSNAKIKNGAVDKSKIADKSIDGAKIEDNVVLHGVPTVEGNVDYEKASVRNIILSPDVPSGGNPGDIWIRYV